MFRLHMGTERRVSTSALRLLGSMSVALPAVLLWASVGRVAGAAWLAGATGALLAYCLGRGGATRDLQSRVTLLEAQLGAALDGIVVVARDGEILSWNRRFAALWNIPETLLAARSVDTVRAAVLDQLADPDAFVRRSRQLYGQPAEQAREEVALRDGRVFERFSTPLNEAGGAREARIWFYRDITERKQAEEATRRSESQYRTLAANFPEGAVALFDHDLRFTLADGKGLALVGLSKERMEGRTIWEVFPRRMTAQIEGPYRAALAGVESRFDLSFGRRVFEVTTLPVRDERGAVIAGMAMPLDVTARRDVEARLREAEERYRQLVEQLPAIVYTAAVDAFSTTLYTSPQREELLGYSSEEWTSAPDFWLQALHPDDRAFVLAEIERTNAGADSSSMEYRYVAKDGRIVWVRDESVLVRDSNGAPLRWQGVVFDITDHKRAEAALRESEERFRSVFESPAIGIALVGLDGAWLQVNAAICALVGRSERELLATTFQALTHPDDLTVDLEHVRRLLAGEIATYQMEKRYIHRDGRAIWAQLNVSLVRDPDGAPLYFVSQVHDISTRKAIEDELAQMARYDALTRLPNRMLFRERLERALARAERSGVPAAVLYMDLDGFKAVNDSLGHAAGDRLLVEIGARLEGCVRAVDTIARLGGDEFTALLEGVDEPETAAIVCRMLACVEEPFDLDGAPSYIGTSIGVAIALPGERDADRILREADAALYAAKARGKRQSVFFDEVRRDHDAAGLHSAATHAAVGA